MNKIKWSTLWILAVIISSFPACSKKSSTPACKIVSITTSDNSAGYTLTYDDQGRTTSVQENNNGALNQLTDFKYSGNTVLVTSPTSTVPASDSIVLNSDGDVDFIVQTSNGVSSIINYSYSSPGVLSQSSSSTGNGAPAVVNYYYSNGDLDSASDGEKFTYYEDQPYKIGDYLELEMLIQYGNMVPLFKHTHMLKSFSTNGSSTTVSYTYDNSGKVTSLSAVGGAGSTLNIDYDCGQ